MCVRKLKRSASEITALLLPTTLSVKYLLVFHSVNCGLWIAPHKCNDTFTPLFTTVHTYKWRSVRKQNSDILRLLDALHQVVLHFFTCLTTALLVGKVNSYSFKRFCPPSIITVIHTHTHTHTRTHVPPFKEPNHLYKMSGCISTFIKDILNACWLNGMSQQIARLLFWLVLGGASFVSHWQHTTQQQDLLVFCTPFR